MALVSRVLLGHFQSSPVHHFVRVAQSMRHLFPKAMSAGTASAGPVSRGWMVAFAWHAESESTKQWLVVHHARSALPMPLQLVPQEAVPLRIVPVLQAMLSTR